MKMTKRGATQARAVMHPGGLGAALQAKGKVHPVIMTQLAADVAELAGATGKVARREAGG